MTFTYQTNGKTCTSSINIELDDNNCIKELSFSGGGCQGNLTALRAILLGKEAKFVIDHFKGIQCGNRGTSCADQLALCVEKALEMQNSPKPEKCFFYKSVDNEYAHECTLLNSICEQECDHCVYTINKLRYEELVNKVKNNMSNAGIIL